MGRQRQSASSGPGGTNSTTDVAPGGSAGAPAQTGLRQGARVFGTRPLSLVLGLILAVVILVCSFLLLLFPVMGAYYYAVRESRRERFFIDLEVVLGNLALVVKGIRRCFWGSYALGLFGLIPAIVLYVAPVIPLEVWGREGATAALFLQVLLLPAFFLAGAVVFYGFPALAAGQGGFASLGHAVAAGRQHLGRTMALGFLLLFPIPAALIHIMMPISYPLLVSWALSGTVRDAVVEVPLPARPRGAALVVAVVAGLVGLGWLAVKLWGAPGLVGVLGIGLAILLGAAVGGLGAAAGLMLFALLYVALALGGGSLAARRWGDEAFLVWNGVCLAGLIFIMHRLTRRKSGD